MSVRAGDTLKIMVSTNPVSEFSLEIFRTSYYGGDGARSVKRFDSLRGQTQPDPPIGENRLRECKWEPSVALNNHRKPIEHHGQFDLELNQNGIDQKGPIKEFVV